MTMGAFSGFIANPEIAPAVWAAAQAINAEGGINGALIEQIVCDTEGDPNKEAECAQQAVDEGVAAVVGAIFLSGADAYPILEAASIPVIGVVANTQSDFVSPVSFPVTGSIVGSAAILAAALADGGSEHIAAVYVDLPAAAAVPMFATAGLARFGLAIEANVPVPYGAPDMATYVAAATTGATDGVVVFLSGQDALNFVTALKQAAPDMPVAMMMSQMEDTLAALGDAAEGLIFPLGVPHQHGRPGGGQVLRRHGSGGGRRCRRQCRGRIRLDADLRPGGGHARRGHRRRPCWPPCRRPG